MMICTTNCFPPGTRRRHDHDPVGPLNEWPLSSSQDDHHHRLQQQQQQQAPPTLSPEPSLLSGLRELIDATGDRVSQSIATTTDGVATLSTQAVEAIKTVAMGIRFQRRVVSSPAAPEQPALPAEEARRRAEIRRFVLHPTLEELLQMARANELYEREHRLESARLAREWEERRRIARELFRQFLLRRRPNSEDVARNAIKRQTCPRLRACTPFGCTRG